MNNKRIRTLTSKKYTTGPIVYWMSRDQRVHDNWALTFALEMAKETHTSASVIFCLRPQFEQNTKRIVDFMLKGLQEVEETLAQKNISFSFLIGDPVEEIEKFCKEQKVGALVSDFKPLQWNRAWKDQLKARLTIPFFEVDAHNIVPCWIASPKQEFGAYTLRPKIHFHLQEFLEEFPKIEKQNEARFQMKKTDWDAIAKKIKTDGSVPPVDWIKPGEKAALQMLHDFIENRLENYDEERNDPTKKGQSQLSPYIHFGHISSQRIALAINLIRGHTKSKEAFLEELIVRKELSDNYCFYNPHYQTFAGFPNWAKETLEKHRDDDREFVYTKDELEQAITHDPLWNAAQKEMVLRGKMHGYMRMYWAKKIFEWTKSPEDAQKIAIYLNDKYFLDGRDPNGYTGIAWSIGGVHDRAWFDRPIFGKIRFMSYNGAKGKFDVEKYIKAIGDRG